jgi:hypothetical protein
MKINKNACESGAELVIPGGGAKRARTADPLLAKQVLYQLSYSPRNLRVRRPRPGYTRHAKLYARRIGARYAAGVWR